MAYPFNTTYVAPEKGPRNVDVSDTHDGHIRLEPGMLSHEQLAELMHDAEVYVHPVG